MELSIYVILPLKIKMEIDSGFYGGNWRNIIMDYISFVDIENKKIYDIGKRSSAKYYLPFLAYKYQGKPVVIYGDETHGYLEDKYEVKEYGGEYEECLIENENIDGNILDDITMSIEEFREIFEKIGGKALTNLEDYIRYKYRPELK